MKESTHTQANVIKWDKWAQSIDGKGKLYDHLRNSQSHLIALLNMKENFSFLDIGCGTGWAVGQAAKLVDGKGLFYGVDLSPKMIDKAKENFKGYANFHFIQGSSESIPLDNDSFDIIICTTSFHHYLHPDKALKEMQRLLKVGGKIYILDPTADLWIAKIADKLIRIFETAHVKLYSTKEFKKLILDAGLKYAGCETITSTEKIHMGVK